MGIKYKSDFDTSSSISTGGVTGSLRVKLKSNRHNHQLKPSMLDNKLKRRLKAAITDVFGITDRENFGEVIASDIGRALLANTEDPEFPLVPKVHLVYDKDKKRVLVASEYLKSHGVSPETLDDYAKRKGVKENKRFRHITFSFDHKDKDKPGFFHLHEQQERQDLANAIALSAIVEDHDVNPGNMMGIQDKNGKTRIARIDFGHAAGDLIRKTTLGPSFGGERIHNNSVIDYINRETLSGGSKPKLWRDYVGIIPSKEMVVALKNIATMADSDQLKRSILATQHNFKILLKEAKTPKEKKHILKSLASIAKNSGTKISRKFLHMEDNSLVIDTVFKGIYQTMKKNLHDAEVAANIMELQLEIHNYLNDHKTKPGKETIEEMKRKYIHIKKSLAPDKFCWLKTDANTPAFEGGLEAYIHYRMKQLGIKKSPKASSEQEETSYSSQTTEDTVSSEVKAKTIATVDKLELSKDWHKELLVDITELTRDQPSLKVEHSTTDDSIDIYRRQQAAIETQKECKVLHIKKMSPEKLEVSTDHKLKPEDLDLEAAIEAGVRAAFKLCTTKNPKVTIDLTRPHPHHDTAIRIMKKYHSQIDLKVNGISRNELIDPHKCPITHKTVKRDSATEIGHDHDHILGKGLRD